MYETLQIMGYLPYHLVLDVFHPQYYLGFKRQYGDVFDWENHWNLTCWYLK